MAADVRLDALALAEQAAWKKLLGDSSAVQPGQQLFLVLPDGGVLADPNAIARYLGAPVAL